MIIYEITAVVRTEFIEEYEKYMRERHIPDLLATGFFQAADFTCSAAGRYRICYKASNCALLDEYLRTDAERLRADFLTNFPEGIELSREIWEVMQSWEADSTDFG